MLYPAAPTGEEMTIVPVATVQDGCDAAEATGTEGGVGWALTVMLLDGADSQPIALSLTV